MKEVELIKEVVGHYTFNQSLLIIGSIAIIIISSRIIEYLKRKSDNNKISITNSELTKQLSNISENLTNISGNMVQICSFIHGITTTIISKDKDKCRVTIDLAFKVFCKNIVEYSRDLIITTNCSNREVITADLNAKVSSEYYKVFGTLSMYEIDGERVNSYMKDCWRDEIVEVILSVIYSNTIVDRNTYLHSKLNVKFTDYEVYVQNKTFNV